MSGNPRIVGSRRFFPPFSFFLSPLFFPFSFKPTWPWPESMQSQNVNPPGRSFLFFPFHQTSDISFVNTSDQSLAGGVSAHSPTRRTAIPCRPTPGALPGAQCDPLARRAPVPRRRRSPADRRRPRSLAGRGRAGAGAQKDKRRRGGGEGLFEILGIHPSAGTDTTRREVIWSRWNGWARRRPAPPLTTGAGPTVATAAFSQRTTRPCARRANVVRIMLHHLCGLGLINVRFWVVDG